MLHLLSGYWVCQALYVAAALNIADRLAEGPKTADDLAREAGAAPDALNRLLRGLTSMGIFAMGTAGFELTPLSETLLSQKEDSLRPVALLGGHKLHWQAWGGLLDSVRTGQTAFDLVHGEGFFDALAREPDLLAQFHRISDLTIDGSLLAALVLHRYRRIVDVGGGTGALARRIAAEHPQAEVVLFDRPEVIAAAADATINVAAGDFFETVPESGDAYILKFVLHDWDDEAAIRILSCCARSMAQDGRLLVVEVVLPDDATPSIARTHDVNMLVLTGGRERTLAEYTELLRRAGLTPRAQTTTQRGISVLEAALSHRPVVLSPITTGPTGT